MNKERLREIVANTELFPERVPVKLLTDVVGNAIQPDQEYVMSHKPPNFGWYGGVQDGKFFLVHDWGQAYVVLGRTLLDKPKWILNWDAILLADVGEVAETMDQDALCFGAKMDTIRPHGLADRDAMTKYAKAIIDLDL